MINKIKKEEKGITLIALVITIIVLLILAGVAISMLSGENGILRQAANAKTETEKQSTLEQIKLAVMSAMTNPEHKIKSAGDLLTALQQQGLNNIGNVKESMPIGYIAKIGDVEYRITDSGDVSAIIQLEGNQGKILNANENTLVKDEYGNIIVVPAGFGIVTGETVNNASNATQGIVITDKFENGVSTGNEFVWIPVGKVYTTTDETKTEENTKTVKLGRYSWSGNTGTAVQTVTTEAEAISAAAATVAANSSYYEVTPDNATYPQSTYKNARAANLVGFLKSAVKNGGYYIARYEAGITGTKDNYTLSQEGSATATTVKPQSKKGLGVWNCIKQTDASKVSKAMYSDSNFTSDLINSYAWDTAIIFIQQMSGRNDYAGQNSLNQGSPITTGTSGDVQYNIYDMASNVLEWSTETHSNSSNPCVRRGGYCGNSNVYTFSRNYNSDYAFESGGFRPLLYV